MQCLGNPNSFHFDCTLMNLFFNASILGIESFYIIAWGANTLEKDWRELDYLYKKVSKITKQTPRKLSDCLANLCSKILNIISKDSFHPHYHQIKRPPRSNSLMHLKSKQVQIFRFFHAFLHKIREGIGRKQIMDKTTSWLGGWRMI